MLKLLVNFFTSWKATPRMDACRSFKRALPMCRVQRAAHLAPCLAALLLTQGCATTDPSAMQAKSLWQGVSAATPCCRSTEEALASATPLTVFSSSFNRSTPHFDFGDGLAPYAAFTLDSASKLLEVEAPAQRVPMIQGGDGVLRYFDAKLVFFDKQGHVLPREVVAQSQRRKGQADRSYFQYVRVPQFANTVVLTTDPKKNREHHVSVVRGAPQQPLTSKSTEFFVFGGVMPDGHKSASYGAVALRSLPNE